MIKEYIKRFIFSLVGLSIPNQSINIYKTLLFNYIAFGLKGIIYRPVFIYNNVKIYKVGKIIFHCQLKPGLLKIGHLDYKSQGFTKFFNSGTIEIYNSVTIGGASIIENRGNIIYKGMNLIGDGCYIFIRKKLEIGEQSRIGFHSFIMDSDDHYTVDIENRQVSYNKKEIIIGKYNWIASHSYIKKGTKTPDFLIVASANALLTKDYTSLPPYSVIGGSPAKLLKSGVRRIYNSNMEQEINQFFKENPYTSSYKIDDSIVLDDVCKETHL
jgi:acetyltransferase-like isoleucine patch superfamily enzyme